MRQKRRIHEKITNIKSLPSFPAVAHRLLAICSDLSHSAANDVAHLLSGDPALTARVLRLANSAYYAPAYPVTTLTQAVVVLGTRVISTMVLAMSVFEMFPDTTSSTVFNRETFWRHCLACGVIGKSLVTKNAHLCTAIDPETAFCAGLLHDIGAMVMEQYLHEDHTAAYAYAKEHGYSCYEAEEKVLGYSHTTVADWLTESWGLPNQLRMPVIWHHDPASAPEHEIITTVCHFADWFYYDSQSITNPDVIRPHYDVGSINKLKMSAQSLEEIRSEWPAMVNELANLYLEK